MIPRPYPRGAFFAERCREYRAVFELDPYFNCAVLQQFDVGIFRFAEVIEVEEVINLVAAVRKEGASRNWPVVPEELRLNQLVDDGVV